MMNDGKLFFNFIFIFKDHGALADKMFSGVCVHLLLSINCAEYLSKN